MKEKLARRDPNCYRNCQQIKWRRKEGKNSFRCCGISTIFELASSRSGGKIGVKERQCFIVFSKKI